MGDSSHIDAYRAARPTFERLTSKLRQLLEDLLRAENIAVHAIEARAKTIDSFAEKIERAGKSYADPLCEITDLAGLRIILYYLDDVDRTIPIIEREFDVDIANSVDKRLALAPDQLGYLSVHKVVRLGESRRELAEWKELQKLPAEIQVRTLLQHTWAAIHHTLDYKRAAEIPKEYRRRLFRMSGLLELADEEFARLRQKETALEKAIGERIDEGDLGIPINAVSVRRFLAQSALSKQITKSAKASGMKVTSPKSDSGISQLVQIAGLLNMTAIRSLQKELYKVPPAKTRAAFRAMRESLEEGGSRQVTGSPGHFVAVAVCLTDEGARALSKIVKLGIWGDHYVAALRKARRTSGLS